MEEKNTIVTLFEFTSTGYDTVKTQQDEALARSAALRKEGQELAKSQNETASAIDKQLKVWEQFNNVRRDSASITKEERENYVQAKKDLESLTATQAKVTAQREANAKAQDAENKKAKEAADLVSTYKRVMDELSKGMDNAEVSTSALAKAKKYLNSEMSKKDIGTDEYKKYSVALAQVQKTINDTNATQREQTKQAGVAADSVEALRLTVSRLKKEWLSMSQTDPGFADKEAELKKYTDQLTEAEERVGIFSRSVGNYAKAGEAIAPVLQKINSQFPVLGKQLKGITGLMEISVGLMKAQASQVGILTKAKNLWTTATTKTSAALIKLGFSAGVANVAAQVLMATLTLGLSAAIGAVIALWAKFSSDAKKAREDALAFGKATADMAGESISNFRSLQAQWDSLGDSLEAKKKFVEQNKEAFKNLGVEVNNVKDAENILVNNSEAFVQALMIRARAAASAQIAAEQYKIALEKQMEAETIGKNGVGFLGNKARQIRKAEEAAAEATAKAEKATKTQIELNQQYEDSVKALGITVVKTDDQKSKSADDTTKKYIDAYKARLKAAEDLQKAEIDGDTKGIEIYKSILDEKDAALKTASKKRITMTQAELDELELAEYVHQRNVDKMRADADKKQTDEAAAKQKTITDGYLKASTDYRNAQTALLEAQKRGNADEIALYQRLLDQKAAALTKYNADEVQLSEEQRLAEDIAAYDHQQKIVNDYIALQQQLAELQTQFNDAQTQAERDAIQKQINLVNAKVTAQVQALQALGVNIDGINVNVEQSIDTTQQHLFDRLQQSLQTIEQFSGRSKNNFFKLASSITGLVAKAFDFKKVTAGMDKTKKAFNELKKEFTAGMAEIGAAVAINGLNAAVDIINQNIEAEKQAIDEMYTYQEKRAQESYDQQSRDLKFALDDKQISEAKYRLEQMKLDDKKAKEDKNREKDKANAMYDLEVKQFRVNQAKDAISTVIATSLGIMQSYAQAGPIVGSILAAVVGALGAAQVGLIYAQKPPKKPKFEKGGGIRFEPIDGPSHDDGGVPIRFGNKVVAEAEGDEGALIISKKAMRNSYMRRLLKTVLRANEEIAGGRSRDDVFAEGGYLSYEDDFLNPEIANVSANTEWLFKRTYRVFNELMSRDKNEDREGFVYRIAEERAKVKWNEYIDQMQADLNARESQINDAFNAGIQDNETLKSMGVTDITSFNKIQADKEKELDTVQKQIKVYEEAANARIDALKAELQYDQKLADFEKQRKEAAAELATATEEFNTRVLGELRETGQITEEEHLSMLDQIKHGYGIKTTDIINLKKKEVEALKKMINEERDAELNAAKETAKYREDALAQMRSEWEENYNAITQQIIDDVENASEAISQLTGTDLERFNQILHIQQEIKKMEEDYAKNESLLTDGVITNREERAAMVAEQNRIKEELTRKEQEAEEAKAAFEAERQKNMESARKAYETENFADLLEQIKALGSELQTEGNKWTIDKELAAELDAELQAINTTYDEQITKQDAIIDGMQAEIDAAQLLHDKKVAYIKEEEEALKSTFEEQKATIDMWLADATSGLRTEAAELAQFVAALKVAGIEAGITEYEKAMEELNKNIDAIESTGGKKYATGGAIEIGSGLYQVAGPSHTQGGVPIRVGNTQIAEVEGIEKMFAVNKMAASDPEMMAALAHASDVNARYTGVPLIDGGSADGFTLDYDLLAAKIGSQINRRPVETYVTYRAVKSAYDTTQMHKKARFMQ